MNIFSNDRNLLVVPRGGLNDILCQLSRCYIYAHKENRNLLIDTKPSGIGLSLDVVFKRKNWAPIFFTDYKNFLLHSNGEIFPKVPIEVDGSIQFEYSGQLKNYVTKHSAQIFTFNHNKSYDENTLIHLQCGGGDFGHLWFQLVEFQSNFLDDLKSKFSLLPEEYDAVHVRNTDMKTDFVKFFSEIKDDVRGKKLLVCSDNHDVITYAKLNLPAEEIITISNIPQNGETRLHENNDYNQDELYSNLVNSFADLIALAFSKNLHLTKNVNGGISGFSVLASNLFKNKQLLSTMLENNG